MRAPGRRLTAGLLLAGLAALAAFLGALVFVFTAEDDARRAELEASRSALEAYATSTLQRALEDEWRLGVVLIDEALEDPLRDDTRLLLVADDGVVLPRRASGTGAGITELAQQLVAGTFVEHGDVDDPATERRAFVLALRGALDTKATADLERAVRGLLAHRRLHRLTPRDELSTLLAMVELLQTRSTPARVLLERVLREGFGPDERGLMRQVLHDAPMLTTSEVTALCNLVEAQARRAQVPVDDFVLRCRHVTAAPVVLPRLVTGLVGEARAARLPWDSTGARDAGGAAKTGALDERSNWDDGRHPDALPRDRGRSLVNERPARDAGDLAKTSISDDRAPPRDDRGRPLVDERPARDEGDLAKTSISDDRAPPRDDRGRPLGDEQAGRDDLQLAGGYLVKGEPRRGVAVDARRQLELELRSMQERGLLGLDDALELTVAEGPVRALQVAVASPRWEAAARERNRALTLKLGLLSLAFVLGLGLVALVFSLQRQEQKLVDVRAALVSTVSHELRTPLASLRVMAETLERRLDGVPQAKEWPARIVGEVDGLTVLVENILAFNRLEQGRDVVHREPLALTSLSSWLTADAGPGLTVTTAGLEGLTVDADATWLRIAVLNLLRNARTYNEREPVTFHVEARREGARVVLHFVDNGIGIPREAWESVFEAFHRLREARGRGAGGSGLGLALVRKVVEAHGGTVRVHESSPAGTTFRVDLPLRP
ncbi:MAG: HAMP domain-containing histidine kinase [Myxococcaceae bacterium]|jgi:signal transduction histidine kinase|nr:HAMP domain-containing histidine kinase [Myxococcaceae bacterium]